MRAVTTAAIVKRINRKLAPNQKLRKTRGLSWRYDLCAYYLQDVETSFLIAGDVDVDELARELDVLGVDEVVVEEGPPAAGGPAALSNTDAAWAETAPGLPQTLSEAERRQHFTQRTRGHQI